MHVYLYHICIYESVYNVGFLLIYACISYVYMYCMYVCICVYGSVVAFVSDFVVMWVVLGKIR